MSTNPQSESNIMSSKPSFASAKYQSVIRTVNALIKAGGTENLRKRFMAAHRLDPKCGGTEVMSAACVSTYFANVTSELRESKQLAPTVVETVRIPGKAFLMSVCTVDHVSGIIMDVEVFTDEDAYLETDTAGRRAVKGLTAVVGAHFSTPTVPESYTFTMPKFE